MTVPSAQAIFPRPRPKRDLRTNTFTENAKESVQGEEIMATATTPARPPFPPFTRDSAMEKVRLAEDAWNTRDPATVALAYAIDSRWRKRSEVINGRNEIIAFSLASGVSSWTTG